MRPPPSRGAQESCAVHPPPDPLRAVPAAPPRPHRRPLPQARPRRSSRLQAEGGARRRYKPSRSRGVRLLLRRRTLAVSMLPIHDLPMLFAGGCRPPRHLRCDLLPRVFLSIRVHERCKYSVLQGAPPLELRPVGLLFDLGPSSLRSAALRREPLEVRRPVPTCAESTVFGVDPFVEKEGPQQRAAILSLSGDVYHPMTRRGGLSRPRWRVLQP